MSKRFYPAVVVKLPDEDGGGYAAYAPDLDGCASGGETPAKAIKNLMSAIESWCAERRKLGERVPEPGSAEKARNKEREDLLSLVKEQDRVIKEQDRAVGRVKEDMETIRLQVVKLMEKEEKLKSQIDELCAGDSNKISLKPIGVKLTAKGRKFLH